MRSAASGSPAPPMGVHARSAYVSTTSFREQPESRGNPMPSSRAQVEAPLSNPTTRHGQRLPAEGENGVFSKGWFPICTSQEVAPGQIRGEDFLDGRVVVYRGDDGVARVMS